MPKPSRQRVFITEPSEPERPCVGYLNWADGAAPSLEIDVLPDVRPNWLKLETIDVLHVVSPEAITLFDVRGIGGPLSYGADSLSFHTGCALIGSLETRDSALYDEATLDVEGCSLWFGATGLTAPKVPTATDADLLISYKPVATEWLNLQGGVSFGYGVGMTFNMSNMPERSVRLQERSQISIRLSQPAPPDVLLRQWTKIKSFFEFATDESFYIHRVLLSSHGHDSTNVEMVASWKHVARELVSGILWLFPRESVQANLEAHLNKWLQLYDHLPLALDLYRTSKQTKSLQVEFRLFAIISALESLHRSLYDVDEPEKCEFCKRHLGLSLDARLRDLVKRHEPWVGKLLKKSDCERVAATRNYLAHQTAKLQKRSIPSEEWFYWYRRLTVLFEFCVLAYLPFTNEARDVIVKNKWNAIESGSLGDWNF